MKNLITLSILSLSLVACVDTTGLSPQSTRPVHPQSSENAAVIVAEYADLQCPACKSAHDLLVKPIIQEFGSQIRYEFHHMPLSSIHQFAVSAAEGAECAADQGKFWEFIDLAYEKQSELSNSAIDSWGEELGLDLPLFERCRASHIKRDFIMEEYDQGKSMGVNGTPTFFVNGVQVDSTIDALRAAIASAVGTAGKNL